MTNPQPYGPYDPYYDPYDPYYSPTYSSWSGYNYHKDPKFVAVSLMIVSVVGVRLFGKRNTEELEKIEPQSLLSILEKDRKSVKTAVYSTIN